MEIKNWFGMISEAIIKTSIKIKDMLVIFTLEGIIIRREK